MITTSENHNLNFDRGFNIFPNPAYDKISISGIEKNSLLRIYDSMGKKCFEQKAESVFMMIDISRFTPGIYLVQSENSICKKLIID